MTMMRFQSIGYDTFLGRREIILGGPALIR